MDMSLSLKDYNSNDIKMKVMKDYEHLVSPNGWPAKLKTLIEKYWSPKPKECPNLKLFVWNFNI